MITKKLSIRITYYFIPIIDKYHNPLFLKEIVNSSLIVFHIPWNELGIKLNGFS